MKTIVCEKEECCRRAADQIQRLMEEKPDAVLALACGRSMQPLFEELAKRRRGTEPERGPGLCPYRI